MGASHTIPDPVSGEIEFRMEMRGKALQALQNSLGPTRVDEQQVIATRALVYATLACSHLQGPR